MNFTSFFLGMCVFAFPFLLKAQNIEYVQLEPEERAILHQSQNPFNAVVLRAKNQSFEGVFIETDGGVFQVSIDEHYYAEDGYSHSNPIHFDHPVKAMNIKGLIAGTQIAMVLMRIPEAPANHTVAQPRSNCDKPELVLQEVWRSGLPEPEYKRVFNQVRNIILHHSATSNSISDHMALVRSIYTYHTQINGWSDIGYNYLIAPDGVIYAGRDPGNLVHEDEVLGAHFCASNTGTMGICLLGTFTETEPTAEAMASLNHLLAWKMAKDSLYPLGVNPHPLNPQLGIIAAHRHGCATVCPGDAFIDIFSQIKHNSNSSLHDCDVFLHITDHRHLDGKIKVFPNPITSGQAFVELKGETAQSVELVRSDGIRFPLAFNQAGIKLFLQTDVPKGLYILVVTTQSNTYNTKVLKTNN